LTFVKRERHARVPQSHVEGSFRLGQWVSIQEARGRAGQLDSAQVSRLKALPGWTWGGRHAAQWEDGLARLKSFAAKQGHARVPQGYVDADFNLGRWVNKQRIAFREGRLSPDRVQRLQAVPGWVWTVR
jgi:hypothetical protein